MVRQGLRRLATVFTAIIAVTVAIAALVGLAAGANLLRAIAVGLYLDGIMLLGGCFVVGARGPLRGVTRQGETVPLVGASGVRPANPDERSEATRTSIALFVFGILIVVLASLIDPAHKAF